jgi:endonuclease-8
LPEGDTILAHAQHLAPLLVGQPLTAVTTQGLERDLAGRTVTAVHSHGKHLLIDLDDGTRIRTHLGMPGRIRSYRPSEAAALLQTRSPGGATLVLHTPIVTVIWWRARTVEILPRRAHNRDAALARLGPDILAADFDPADTAARAAAEPAARLICDVLLDQRISAGLGNIYKNESLAAQQLHPSTPVGTLTAAQLTALYATAQRLMRLRDRRRHVYGRTGEPCERCETPIRRAELGDPPRTTWWCPQCQAPAGANR